MEAARALALRILAEGGTTRRRAARPTPSASALSRPPTDAGDGRSCSQLLEKQTARFADGWVNPRELADRQGRRLPTLPAGDDAGDSSAGLHRRRPRAAEPRRDDHQGMTGDRAMTRPRPLPQRAPRRSAHPPLVLPGVRRRPRRHRAGLAARRAPGAAAPAAARRPTRSRRSSRTSRRRPSASSSCSWPGAPSHLELFDHKPELAKFNGTLPPRRAAEGLPRRVHQPELDAARPEVQVRQARPERRRALASCCRTSAKVVDDIAIVKSMADRRVQPRARRRSS